MMLHPRTLFHLWSAATRPLFVGSVQVISVSIEKRLLTRADRLARKLRLPRTQLTALGLEALLENPSLVQE